MTEKTFNRILGILAIVLGSTIYLDGVIPLEVARYLTSVGIGLAYFRKSEGVPIGTISKEMDKK